MPPWPWPVRCGPGPWLMGSGEDRVPVVERAMARVVAAEPLVALDYAAVVHADDLEPAARCSGSRPLRLLIAATVGPVRLIDNLDPGQVWSVPGLVAPGLVAPGPVELTFT